MTLACADIQSGIQRLADIGYRLEFVETALPSDPSKAPLLSTPRDMHTLAFARPERGLPIELVHYAAQLPEPRGRYIGVFGRATSSPSGADALSIRAAAIAATAYGRAAMAGHVPGFDAPALFSPEGEAGLVAAVLPVADVERSQTLWCGGLGFRPVSRGDGWILLRRISPVAAWCFDIVLAQDADRGPDPQLDGRGMTCLSFVCLNLERGVQSLSECGARQPWSIFETRVNGRGIRVAMVGGMDGEFIELLEVAA